MTKFLFLSVIVFCFAIICITSSVSLYYYHYCEWWKIVVMKKKELRTKPSNYLLSSIAEVYFSFWNNCFIQWKYFLSYNTKVKKKEERKNFRLKMIFDFLTSYRRKKIIRSCSPLQKNWTSFFPPLFASA